MTTALTARPMKMTKSTMLFRRGFIIRTIGKPTSSVNGIEPEKANLGDGEKD